MPASACPTTILVTGASGYIASWLVKYLLDEGHTVHATVRNPAKATHLQTLAEGTKGTLTLFKADLLTPGSFDEAMQGCSLVMHTASPSVLEGFTDAHEALVRPAVEGTRNVLEAVQRTESVRCVVLTSSVASVFGDNNEIRRKASGRFDESDWNTTSSVNHNPYQYSKVAAEREAWKMQQGQSRWDLVTINPAMVYGPSLTPASQSASIDTLVQMGDGRLRTGVPDLGYGVVDVREVARACTGRFHAQRQRPLHSLCKNTVDAENREHSARTLRQPLPLSAHEGAEGRGMAGSADHGPGHTRFHHAQCGLHRAV